MSKSLVGAKNLTRFLLAAAAFVSIGYIVLTSTLSTPLALSLMVIFLFVTIGFLLGTRRGAAPIDADNTDQISDPIFVNDTVLVNDTWILKH